MRLWAALALAAGLWAADAPFSHKKHAPLKMACATCHQGAESKARAGFPTLAQCQTCHREYRAAIPSQRIYKLADFVFFSHSVHVKAKSECSSCHGEMWRQETVTLARPLKMANCIDCHKEKHATETCNACHELGQ